MPARKTQNTAEAVETTETPETPEASEETTETTEAVPVPQIDEEAENDLDAQWEPKVAEATVAWDGDEAAVLASRLSLGRTLGLGREAYTGLGMTKEDAQNRLISFAQNAVGKVLTWDRFEDFVTAAAVYDGLGETTVTAAGNPVRDFFSVETLNTLRGIPEEGDAKKNIPTRAAVATEAVENGTLSARSLREIVREKKKRKKPAARNTSAAIVKKHEGVAAEAIASFCDSFGETPETFTEEKHEAIIGLVLLGVQMGKKGVVASRSEKNAAEELTFYGPENENTSKEEAEKEAETGEAVTAS